MRRLTGNRTLFSKKTHKEDEHVFSFTVLISLILLPAVTILTKIGEYTVKSVAFGINIITVVTHLLVLLLTKVGMAAIISGKKSAGAVSLLHKVAIKRPTFFLPKPTLPKLKHLHKKAVVHDTVEPSPLPMVIYKTPIFTKLRYFVVGTTLGVLLVTPLLFKLWISELPNPARLAVADSALSSKVYDRNGRFLFQFYAAQNRTRVPLSDIPENMIEATIAIEDKKFYEHNGFDVEAIVRAARETMLNKHLQGGSTITQQLIKSALLTPDITLERKVKEVVLAFMTEQKFTKDQILEMYFNQVPYGGTAWGIESAAQTYFGKSVKELDLAEAALLAGLPSGPSIYSPFGPNPELAITRQHEVLNRMATLGYITREEEEQAKAQELQFASPIVNIKAPHFVMYLKDYLIRRYGIRMVEQGGLQVTTTLDLDMQDKAQAIVAEEVNKLKPLSVSNSAALITNPQTGEILAMVGSRDYFDLAHDGNVNVTTALRQPGSSIKLVTYVAAMEKGMTASTILDDSPITYPSAGGPSYSPVNYDGKFHGKVTLRTAFANSYNVPAVKALAQVGLPTMIETGKRLGIRTWDDEDRFGLSLTLGGGEVTMVDMATVYGTIAGGGVRHNTTPIIRVADSYGNVLEELAPQKDGIRVISEGIAFIISDILADNSARSAAFGPNSVLNIPGYKVSVKTGTTDSKRDNWTIGFNKNMLVAVWVGNNDNSPMNPALTSGITGAAPIWNRLITTALSSQPVNVASETTPPPTEVVSTSICAVNGLLSCSGCPGKTEYFIQGTQPKIACRAEFLTPAPAIGGAEPSPATTN